MIPEQVACPIAVGAREFPQRLALTDGSHRMTYAEMHRRVSSAALLLTDIERAGQPCAVLTDNSIHFPVLLFAALRARCSLLLLNTRLTESDWTEIMNRNGARILVTGKTHSGFVLPDSVRKLSLESLTAGDKGKADAAEEMLATAHEAVIVPTSGSTGQPRYVVLSTGNLYASARGLLDVFPLAPDDLWLAMMPFFHVGGLMIPVRTTLAGCGTRVLDRFVPDQVVHLISSEKITHLSVVPSMLAPLVERFDHTSPPEHLKAIIVGGAALSPVLKEKILHNKLPVYTTYGLTETSSMVTLSCDQPLSDRLQSSGRVLPCSELQVVGPDGRKLGVGEVGRIQVRGETCAVRISGEETEPLASDSWRAAGDTGILTAKGELVVLGRSDRLIVSGGENIDPAEIEQALETLDEVRRAIVVKRVDENWGERPIALVEPDGRIESDKIKAELAKRIARIKLPDRIIIVDAVPVTSNGKADYMAAQALVDKFLHTL